MILSTYWLVIGGSSELINQWDFWTLKQVKTMAKLHPNEGKLAANVP